jgi:hypothetical protein
MSSKERILRENNDETTMKTYKGQLDLLILKHNRVVDGGLSIF